MNKQRTIPHNLLAFIILIIGIGLACTTLSPYSSSAETHQEVFDELWQLVDQEYVYPDYHGADWVAIRDRYQIRVNEAKTDEDFWLAMSDMMDELNDEHSYYLNPAEVIEEDALFRGEPGYAGIGILAERLADENQEVILLVFPDGPADKAGLQIHDILLTADGDLICCDEDGDGFNNVRGPVGTDVALMVQTPGEAPREVVITRDTITARFDPVYRRLEGDIGYILVPTLNYQEMAELTAAAWTSLSETKPPLRGLVLDLRINHGGYGTELKGILELFVDGEMGVFSSRADTRPLQITGKDVHHSQSVPLVILISNWTASYAEVLAGTMQATGRATLIGETSAGNVETIYAYDFGDGSRAWIARETFLPPGGGNWEGVGVVPDIELIQAWQSFAADEDDLALQAAIEVLSSPEP